MAGGEYGPVAQGESRRALPVRLNLAQRVILVIGWAGALWYVGHWVALVAGQDETGWTGYAPLTPPKPKGLFYTPTEDLLLWLALIVLWAARRWWSRTLPAPSHSRRRVGPAVTSARFDPRPTGSRPYKLRTTSSS
jgi:hypothetical protein